MRLRKIEPVTHGVTRAQGGVAYLVCLATTVLLRLLRSNYRVWRWIARHYAPAFDWLGYWSAFFVCRYGQRAVPAYRDFLAIRPAGSGRGKLQRLPETDKDSYARAFDFASRCRRGTIEVKGTSIDESSGATGIPFNWLRSAAELRDTSLNVANYLRLEFPSDNLLTINAFSMGAWATGVTMSFSAVRVGIVKSIGPDLDAIIGTLKNFGPRFDYLITAYPPFLKHLCDRLDAENFPREGYRLYALVGGEPMTEALRGYLERRFLKVRSGYGASDIQIAMAGETSFTVWLRRQMMADRQLRYRFLGPGEDRAPMVFQFNPVEHYIETNQRGELVVTLTNLSVMCPKLRYNIGDEGKTLGFAEVLRTLGAHKVVAPLKLLARGGDLIKLPVLFLFGRRDSTISYMGANIYPQDVEYGLYAEPRYAARIESFCLTLEDRGTLEAKPTINVELRPHNDPASPELAAMVAAFRRNVAQHLSKLSRDYAQSILEDPAAADIQICLFRFGEGPFAAQQRRIKNRYLIPV